MIEIIFCKWFSKGQPSNLRNNSMRKIPLAQALALIFLILFLSCEVGYSQQRKYSPQFQSFLNQVQQTYLASKRNNLASLREKYPPVLAILIGHALKQQMIHVHQNPSLIKQYNDLQREAQAYIAEVARTTPRRLQNGQPYTPEGLWSVVSDAFRGTEDSYILENFGVRTGTMPSVLVASREPQRQTPDRPQGMIPIDDDEKKVEEKRVEPKKNIDLLGEEAPRVTIDKSGKVEVIYPPRSPNVTSSQQQPPPPREVLPQGGLSQMRPRTDGYYRNKSWNDFFYYLRFLENGMVRVAAGDHLASDAGRASVTGERLTAEMYDRDGMMLLTNPGRNRFGQSRDQEYQNNGGVFVLDLKGLTYRGGLLELTSGVDGRSLTGVVHIWGKRYDAQLGFFSYSWNR